MLIFEISLYVAAITMLLYYPVRSLRKNKQYKYVPQLDGTEKVVELL